MLNINERYFFSYFVSFINVLSKLEVSFFAILMMPLAAGLAKNLGKRIGKAVGEVGELSGKLTSFLSEILKVLK